MSTFAFIVLCVQACLIQNVFSQCAGPYGYGAAIGSPLAAPGLAAPWGLNGLGAAGLAAAAGSPYGLGAGLAGPYGAGLAGPYGAGLAGPYGPGAAYGGSGAGNVAVAGELPVGGATSVAGQVPIIGAVEYAGCVPAAGAVTIQGNCACGCNGAYYY